MQDQLRQQREVDESLLSKIKQLSNEVSQDTTCCGTPICNRACNCLILMSQEVQRLALKMGHSFARERQKRHAVEQKAADYLNQVKAV